MPAVAIAGPTTVDVPFAYTGSSTTWTVPNGIYQVSVSAQGGQGGLGGRDSQGEPIPGGYNGVVTGTMDVTPGQVLTIAVGGGGARGASSTSSQAGGTPGTNPLSGYDGGTGGFPGGSGSSGAGGGGGAATVIVAGTSTIVAAGAGGGGGSGQYTPLVGRAAYANFQARGDATSTDGQHGLNVMLLCNNNCDGGGSGAGGGGAQGGAQGNIEFGTGTYTEWMGYGGYPGSNSTAGVSGLSASYAYYAGNSGNGSLTISYVTGAPDVPSAVSGTPRDGGIDLTWNAPSSTGQSALTDYAVQYALATAPNTWIDFADGTSTATSASVTGLTNGIAYIFRVAAVSSAGTGSYSAASTSVSPISVPAAPTSPVVTPGDASLSVAFTGAVSGSPVTNYQYQVGSGAWTSAGRTTSPITITGLTNGLTYTVKLRAISTIGTGATSNSASGVPQTVPGAPSITSTSSTSATTGSVVFTSGYSGGVGITGYQYKLDAGSWIDASGTTSPLTIPNLTAGSSYSVALRAVNAAGAGAASQSSTITMPSAPGATNFTVASGDGTLTVHITSQATGGSPVTGYEFQTATSGPWTAVSGLGDTFTIASLTNGSAYPVSVRATNAYGTTALPNTVTATPSTTPGAPAIVGDTITGNDGTLVATYTAPVSDGGSAITGYEYSTDAGATWRTAGSSPFTISTLSSDGTSALIGGVSYYVEFRAINANGTGAASSAATGNVRTAPAAPALASVTAGDGTLTATFAPTSNGGSVITSYEYRLGGGAWNPTGSLGSTFTIPNLTNGTAHTVTVRATNAIGTSVASNGISGTPATVPGQPTITAMSRADRSLTATVSFTTNGGSSITGWEYSTDGGSTWATATQTASPLVITNLSSNLSGRLVNSTAYPVAVRALNAQGTGVASATVTSAPSTTPVAPTVALTPMNQAAQVAYALSGDGGSPITAIEYSLDGTNWTNSGSLASPFTISGLTNGTAYSVQVRADNVIGNGTASAAASVTPRTAPDAPSAVAAASNTASADVTWTAPFSGGSAITGYTASAYASVSSTTALFTCTTTSALSCSITGLTNGTGYYVSVTATNAVGVGAESSPRVLVTPAARPSAPTINSIAAGNSFLSVTFTAGSAGASPITGYQYQLNGGAWVSTGTTSSPFTISSVTNGTQYAVAMRAISAAGVGVASSATNATPYSTPDAVDYRTITGVATSGNLAISWSAANANGAAISRYDVVAWSALTQGSQSGTCFTTGALTCTISGLANDTHYYVTVQGTNAAGASVRSDPRVDMLPSTKPSAVTDINGVIGDGQVALNWTAGSIGSSAITDYTIWYSTNGTTYTQFTDATSTATSATVTGLTNGTAYTFKVYAVNVNGTGPASAASASYTPLATGVVPILSAPTSIENGFTFTITNYNAALTYSFAALNGGTVTRSTSTVTVLGIAGGASSKIVTTASNTSTAAANANVTGYALASLDAPAFSTPTRTADGFTALISNFDGANGYTATATVGSVTRTGNQLVVTGVGVGVTSVITLTASHSGFSDASATRSGTAMSAGTTPTATIPVRTADGFTFTITNYDPSLTYTFAGTSTPVIANVDGSVTVTGLAAGVASTVTVTATQPGQTVATATVSGTTLNAGVTPTTGSGTQTVDGFTFSITNYSGSYSYLVTSDQGTVANTAGLVAVTGLNPGQSSTVTIFATRTGYTPTGVVFGGSALQTGSTPAFGTPTGTGAGYTVEISNYDSAVSYSLFVPTPATATRVGSTVTVAGLAPTASAQLTVTTSRTGYTGKNASVTGTALAIGTAPTSSTVTRTADGFTFTIANYDPALDYTFSGTGGVTITRNGDTVTVSGLAAGGSSTVTMVSTTPGVSTGSTTVSGTALLTGSVPSLSITTSAAGGYSFTIANYDAAYDYSFATTNGGTATRTGSTVTVTGLDPAVVATTTVTASRSGYTALESSATGSSFGAGSVPSLSGITRTDDGFSFDIRNFDADYGYVLTVDNGTVALVGSTVTVSGLTAGQDATVHIVTSKTGELDEIADVVGKAISAGIAPSFSAPNATANGYTVTIANYAPDAVYSFSAQDGVTVTRSGDRVTVAGVAAGASTDVLVSITRAGYQPSSATASGSAASAPPVALPAAPVVTSPFTSTPIAPSIVELAPGKGSIVVNGVEMSPIVLSTDSGLSLASGGLTLVLALKGSAGANPIKDGSTITLTPGDQLHITVAGFLGGSTVGVWTFSTPLLVSQPVVTPDTNAQAEFALPDLEPGHHTLVVNGTAANGAPVTMSVGFIVAAKVAATAVGTAANGAAADGAGTILGMPVGVVAAGTVSLAVILIGLALFFLLFARRRRREEDEEEFEDSWLAS